MFPTDRNSTDPTIDATSEILLMYEVCAGLLDGIEGNHKGFTINLVKKRKEISELVSNQPAIIKRFLMPAEHYKTFEHLVEHIIIIKNGVTQPITYGDFIPPQETQEIKLYCVSCDGEGHEWRDCAKFKREKIKNKNRRCDHCNKWRHAKSNCIALFKQKELEIKNKPSA